MVERAHEEHRWHATADRKQAEAGPKKIRPKPPAASLIEGEYTPAPPRTRRKNTGATYRGKEDSATIPATARESRARRPKREDDLRSREPSTARDARSGTKENRGASHVPGSPGVRWAETPLSSVPSTADGPIRRESVVQQRPLEVRRREISLALADPNSTLIPYTMHCFSQPLVIHYNRPLWRSCS